MQITVQSVSDVKTNQYGTSSKIRAASGEYYYTSQDATAFVGKTVEIEVTEKTSKSGSPYKIATIKGEVAGAASSNGHGNGKVEWSDYDKLARVAHKLALELEGDTMDGDAPVIDRSRARITFVNTALMALKDGKLWLDDDIPF